MGYLEFYDYSQCAEYVSNFILYEPLENPLEFPQYIPSPTSTIEWQKGDCFDVSILLCSILIGVGYDAYCVIGKAPYETTLKNEGLMSNPYLNIGLKDLDYEKKEVEEEEIGTYTVEERKSEASTFDQKREEDTKREAEMKEYKDNDILDDDEPDRLPPDEFAGKRVHCWVLVKKGKREQREDVFIEPSSGRTWDLKSRDYPYHCVDQVFNNKNFWINLRLDLPIHDVNFDNMDNGEIDEWEYAMIDTVKFPSFDKNNDEEYLHRGKKEEDHPSKKALGVGTCDSRLRYLMHRKLSKRLPIW